MKRLALLFLYLPIISFSQNNSDKNDVFSKMETQDVYIYQNERFFNLKDSIIEINKAPFTILFKTQKAQEKINYGLQISVFKERVQKNEFKLGTIITNYCHNQSSRRLAQSPNSNYLSISEYDWCYDIDEYQIPFCHTNNHHLFYYRDEDNRSMILANSNHGILNLEYTVEDIIDTSKSLHVSNTLLDTIYIVALQDYNFNNIIDEGELIICTLKLTSN